MKATRQVIACAGVLLLIGLAHHADADTLTFQEGDGGAYSSTAATTITAYTSGNQSTYFIVTIVNFDLDNSVAALVRFPDIVGDNPGQIPPGSTITSASLGMTVYIDTPPPGTPEIHKVLVEWDESTVSGISFWSAPTPIGPSVGTMPTGEVNTVVSGDVTSLVQDWADGEPNAGVMIRALSVEGMSFTQYYSDDAVAPSTRPKLTVAFTPPIVPVESTTWGRLKALYR
jgi:hypothetical protein